MLRMEYCFAWAYPLSLDATHTYTLPQCSLGESQEGGSLVTFDLFPLVYLNKMINRHLLCL